MNESGTTALHHRRTARIILLGSVMLVAACGLVYELSAGAVSSYLLGDAVTQFSLVIGVFLCAMGAGAYAARFIRKNLLQTFVELEIWVGLTGGASSMLIFAISAWAQPLFPIIFFSLCAIIGMMTGMEIPLLIRILKEGSDFSAALSDVLALDYLGALAGSLLFPLVALPLLGISRASVVFGILNLSVAWAGLALIKPASRSLRLKLVSASAALILLFLFSSSITSFLEDLLYQDSIVYARSTPYQRIVITRWRDDIRLYLNGNIQFSSVDEARYHECLVIPAMEACARPADVLVLGGGDGLAVREILKYRDVRGVTLVDLDPEMTRLGQTRRELVAINRGALNDHRVWVLNQDAMKFLEQTRSSYDVIIIDLPDPNSPALSKLYSTSFYALCDRRLRPGGVLVTQATSPFYAPEAYWCIYETIKNALSAPTHLGGFMPVPYHVNVPSFGDWGFIMASRKKIDPETLHVTVPTRFLDDRVLRAVFQFGKDTRPTDKPRINRLDQPVLYDYYQKGWNRFNT